MRRVFTIALLLAVAGWLWFTMPVPVTAQCGGGMMGMCMDTTCHEPGETCSPANCPGGMMGGCMNDSTCNGGMMGSCHEGGGGGECMMPNCPMNGMCSEMGMNCGGMMGGCPDSSACHGSNPTPRDRVHQRLTGRPNPFNPTTTLSFSLLADANVTLALFNTSAQLVEMVTKGQYQAGTHAVLFNGSHLPNGIYLARLSVGNEVSTLKLVLIK